MKITLYHTIKESILEIKIFQMSASEAYHLKLATHLAILYADRGEFDRQRKSQAIDAETLGDFFSPIVAMWQF